MRNALLALALAGTGCVSLEHLDQAVRARAAHDFRCPQPQVVAVQVEGTTGLSGYEATGCGWQRAYAARCVIRQVDLDCDVAAAGQLRPFAPPPQQQQPPPQQPP